MTPGTNSDSLADNTSAQGSDVRIVVYPFMQYEIVMRLADSGRLIDVIEVRMNKDFRDYRQKLIGPLYHDVTDLYED